MKGGTTPEGVRWLGYLFPLRADFMATLELPRDLTTAEAERLAAFIETLVLPQALGPIKPGKEPS